jgi:hypothetical protein
VALGDKPTTCANWVAVPVCPVASASIIAIRAGWANARMTRGSRI